MKKITSKQVIALWPGGQLLQDQYFKDIRQRLFREDPHKQKEESGHQKLNSPAATGFGPNERQNNPGAGMELERQDRQQKARGVGSGYNDGESANDETGPGNTPTRPDPYNAINAFNSEEMNRLNLTNNDKNSREKVLSHLKNIFYGPPVRTRSFNVDTLN
jgi:hypothetical protein